MPAENGPIRRRLNGCTDWRRQRAALAPRSPVISVLFAIMFKWLPDTRVEWRDGTMASEGAKPRDARRALGLDARTLSVGCLLRRGHGARGRVTKATAIRGAAVFRLPHRALPGETIAQQGITSSRPELRLARHGERLQVGPSRRNHGRRRNVDAGFGLRPIRVRSVGSVVGACLEDFLRDCLAQLGSLRFRIAVGNGRKVRWPPIYNFSGAMVLRSVKETSMTRAPRLKGTAHHSPSAFSS